MPAPTDDPEFATDATYAADGDAWSGDPPRVDPGAPIRAEGFEPGTLPAEWLNHVLGVHGDWIAWLRDSMQATVTKTARVNRQQPQANGFTTWTPSNYEYKQWNSLANTEPLVLQLPELPRDCRPEISIWIKPVAVRAGANRMEIRHKYQTHATAGGGSMIHTLWSGYDDGTTNIQEIVVPSYVGALGIGGGHESQWIEIWSGTGGGTGDIFYSAEVTWDEDTPYPQ